jgi:arylsulfate sulfotransferase
MHQDAKVLCGLEPAATNDLKAGIPRAGVSIAMKLSFALILAVACPIALFASSEDTAPGRPTRSSSAGLPSKDAAAKPEIPTPTTVTLSTFFFDFGNNLIGNKLVQTAVVITNTGSSTLTMSPKLTGNASYTIVTATSCAATLAAHKSCDMNLQYAPTVSSSPNLQIATLAMNFGNVAAGVQDTISIAGVSAVLKPGVVTRTNQPQVALYTITLPFPGEMSVQFGPTKSYGHTTWVQSTDASPGTISVFVAGMTQKTVYHMAATVVLSNGITVTDTDHTFTTGAASASGAVTGLDLVATTTAGKTPQPGLEMLNPLDSVVVTDLNANILWWYLAPTPANGYIDGVKSLPDGDFLMTIGAISSQPLALGGVVPSMVNEMREVNLGGDTVKEISIDDLNAELATATCQECAGLVLQTFHHDVEPLPNGHWLVLSNILRTLSPTTKPPLTVSPPQPVLGDVIVDLDENLQPVWAWNEFNHMNPNRQPFAGTFPDWTHTNAVLYSPSDGNFIISSRHENFILKVNYKNGTGNGEVIWHLGEGGNFKLIGGTDPTDWMYAQHGPAFFSPNTSGVFSLGIMDNGDDRIFPAGNACAVAKPAASCFYTTIPVFRIDEVARTATLTFHQILPNTPSDNLYNTFGGNTNSMANGNVEYDVCGINGPGGQSWVYEVTQEANPQTVWKMFAQHNLYRSNRIPSMYPGVIW